MRKGITMRMGFIVVLVLLQQCLRSVRLLRVSLLSPTTEKNIIDLIKYTKKKREKEYDIDIDSLVSRQPTRE